MFNCNFFEEGQDIFNLWSATDLHSADNTGDWCRATEYGRCTFLLNKPGSEDVGNGSVQVLQATSNGGAGVKALSAASFTWYKQGVITSQKLWTAGLAITTPNNYLCVGATPPGTSVQVVPSNTTNALQLLIDLDLRQMDTANGFVWFTLKTLAADWGNSCKTDAWAILKDCRFPGAIPMDVTT